MNTKRFVFLPLIAPLLLAPASVQASPLISIGDNTDIFFDGSASIQWTSNVFRDEDNEEEDVIYLLSPGLEMNVGRGLTNADLSVVTRYDISRYADNDDLDNETFHIAAFGTYRASRLDLSGRVSFDEIASTTGSNDESLNQIEDLIEREQFKASLNAEYRYSPKFSVGAGVQYSDLDYVGKYDPVLADRESVTLPVDLFYELTPKVDLSVGYSYRETEIGERLGGSSYENEQHFFNVGARGNLLPKLNGFFKVGYRQNDSDRPGSNSNGMLGLDADLTWSATPKLTTTLGLSSDYGVGGDGTTTENTAIDLSASYSLDANWSSSAYLKYTLREYANSREDDQYRAGLRLSYMMNEHWRFSGGYSFIENDSNFDGLSYTNHMLDLTASLRY